MFMGHAPRDDIRYVYDLSIKQQCQECELQSHLARLILCAFTRLVGIEPNNNVFSHPLKHADTSAWPLSLRPKDHILIEN